MKSLYLRIYLTLVALLLAFAFGSVWLFERHIEQERGSVEIAAGERLTAMAALLRLALPPASAPQPEQVASFTDWGQRLRMAVALESAEGQRIAMTTMFQRRVGDPGAVIVTAPLGDGRHLELVRSMRPPGGPGNGGNAQAGRGAGRADEQPWSSPWLNRPLGSGAPGGPGLTTLAVVLVLLFVGVAAGAYPVVRRLTRRLETLKRGVEQFGQGQLTHRVDDRGRDEVAALASSFNQAADRIETLLRSHQTLLANASHELRSPLARLKMAFEMLDGAVGPQLDRLTREIHVNIGELDALVEEVLLASRLDAGARVGEAHAVDLLALGAEEASRAGATFEPDVERAEIIGEERLLRRALRNLLDNARRYGGPEVSLALRRSSGGFDLIVADRGPGVPVDMRERIFEPFFRLPGHAEMAGGVGLGLSLVKQIAVRHQGSVRCEPREGGGSCFVIRVSGSR